MTRRTSPISLSDLSPKVRGQATRQILAQIKSKEDVAEVPVKSAFPSIRAPFQFFIPVPPSVNHLFATVGKRRIKSKKYKAWLSVAGWKIKEQSPHHIPGDVEINMLIHRPSDRCDLDNRLKATLDLIVSMGLIEDDTRVFGIHAIWSQASVGCRILIAPIEPFTIAR